MALDHKNIASIKQQNEAFVESLNTLPDHRNVSIDQMKELYAKNPKANINMSLDEFVQEFSVRLSDIKIFEDQYLSGAKSFSDIAIGGPKSVSEVALMEAACSLLSPDELQGAIVGKKSVSDVFSMIDKSQITKRTNEIIIERHTQLLQAQLAVKSVWRDKATAQKSNEVSAPSMPSKGGGRQL